MMNKAATLELLLIEDDDIDAMSIERELKKLHIANSMHRARDGIEGLDILRDGSITKPYIVLLDINMPRMNGIEFLAKIRGDAKLKDAIVFILTTSKAEEDRMASYNHNVAGYMVKSDLKHGFNSAVNLLEKYWETVELPSEYHSLH